MLSNVSATVRCRLIADHWTVVTLIDASGMGVGALDFFDSADQLDEAAIEKWWCLGDPRNRTGMWIQGRAV